MRALAFSVLIASAACLAPQALADRQRLSLTEVTYNAQTQTVDVTHRLHLHDAQMALVREGLLDSPDLTSIRAQAQLAVYVSGQFDLIDGEDALALETLGAEQDGNYIYVFQQAAKDASPNSLQIESKILQSVFADQVNHVNVRLTDAVQTFIFTQGDAPKSVSATQ